MNLPREVTRFLPNQSQTAPDPGAGVVLMWLFRLPYPSIDSYPTRINRRGHRGLRRGAQSYLSPIQGLQTNLTAIHTPLAVKHTPLAVKHTLLAVKRTPLAVEHTAPALKHKRRAVEHSPLTVKHKPLAIEHVTPTAEHTLLACEALGVLAHTSNDNDLLALTDVTRTSLDRMGTEELTNRATSVLAAANTRKTELATLQVTQANLDELGQALQDFNEAKTGPRTAVAARSVQTESLPRLIREASGILRDQIDRMVSLFKRTNPEFVSGYQSARVIIDRAATHAAAKSGAPAPGPQPAQQPQA